MKDILFKVLMLKGDAGNPTDEQTQSAVDEYMQAHPEAAIDETIINSAVGDWLDEHPEATTTVQDGSLTEAKLSDSLKLQTIKDYVTPEMFGAVGDGVTDDSSALAQAFQHDYVYIPKKAYAVTEEISVASTLIQSDGGIIKGSVGGYILRKDAFSYDDLGNPSSDLTLGDTSLPVSGLAINDDICVISTDLFNSARNYYNSGEFNSVKNNSKLEHGYFDNYVSANTKIYKLEFGKLSIQGDLTVINNDTDVASGAFMIRGIKNLNIKGLRTYGNGGYSLFINRCYKGIIDGEFVQESSASHGVDYGCCIANSQDIIISGFMSGYRHALAIGGGDSPLNIVNRNIKASGVFNNDVSSNVVALNMHGNCEFCDFSGNTSTGANVAGKNHVLHDLIITNEENGRGIGGVEMLPGKFVYNNIICHAKGNTYGFTFGSNIITGEDYDILISNCIICDPSTGLIAFTGSTTDSGTIMISNVKALADSLSYAINVGHAVIDNYKVFMRNVDFICYEFVSCDVNTDVIYRGTAELTFDNANNVLAWVTPPIDYNFGGNIKVSISRPNTLGHLIIPFVFSVASRRFQVVAYTVDSVAVSGTIEIQYELS